MRSINPAKGFQEHHQARHQVTAPVATPAPDTTTRQQLEKLLNLTREYRKLEERYFRSLKAKYGHAEEQKREMMKLRAELDHLIWELEKR